MWQDSLRRNKVAFIVNKRVWNAVLGCNLKKNRVISVPFQGKSFNITICFYSVATGKYGLGIQNEAGQRLIEFCQENALVIANILFQQHKRKLCTWTSPDGQHRNHIDYIICSQRWRSSIQSAKTRPGADYGSDHEKQSSIMKISVASVSILMCNLVQISDI